MSSTLQLEYKKMSNPTIGNILEASNNTIMKDLPVVLKALKMAGVLTPIRNNMTAKDLLSQLRQNDPDVLGRTITQLLRPEQKGLLHDCKSIAMWVTLIVVSISIAATNIYVSIMNNQLIPWEDSILSLLAPILIVLQERGVVSRENRDSLAAVTGNHPIPTIMEALATRIVSGPRQSTSRKRGAPNVKGEASSETTDY